MMQIVNVLGHKKQSIAGWNSFDCQAKIWYVKNSRWKF